MGRAPAAQAHMPAERAQASPASAAGANLKTKIAQGIARARRFAGPAGAGRSGMDGAMEGLTPRPRAALARGLRLGRGFLPPGEHVDADHEARTKESRVGGSTIECPAQASG